MEEKAGIELDSAIQRHQKRMLACVSTRLKFTPHRFGGEVSDPPKNIRSQYVEANLSLPVLSFTRY